MSEPPYTFRDAMADVITRFILNCPEEELQSFERIFFQIEQAHWFYVDFLHPEHPHLPHLAFRAFSARVFEHCPMLSRYRHMFDAAVAKWSEYKIKVPSIGAILLNSALDRCVLVKGWTASSAWGFPKGKINKDEGELECAVREVAEEVGFDAAHLADANEYLELKHGEKRIRLYVIRGVPEGFPFVPQTRKEISKIAWTLVDALPIRPGAKVPESSNGYPITDPLKAKSLFMVQPFVAKLKGWIKAHSRRKRKSFPVLPNNAGIPSRVYVFEEGGVKTGPHWSDLVWSSNGHRVVVESTTVAVPAQGGNEVGKNKKKNANVNNNNNNNNNNGNNNNGSNNGGAYDRRRSSAQSVDAFDSAIIMAQSGTNQANSNTAVVPTATAQHPVASKNILDFRFDRNAIAAAMTSS